MPEDVSFRKEIASPVDRLYALIIDYIIIFFIPYTIISASGLLLDNIGFSILRWLFLLLFIKDLTGSSPGKKILGLQVVRKYDYFKRANPITTIIRNLFLVFGIIEPLVILFNRGRRIADMITDTVVVKVYRDTSIEIPEENYEDDLSEATVCIVCGSEIKANSIKCEKCGWSYKDSTAN